MQKLTSKLILYRDDQKDSILMRLSDLVTHYKDYNEVEVISKLYGEVKALLDIATQYGFDCNLWHDYLTYYMISNENSFTLTSEKRQNQYEGSVNLFAKHDFAIFKQLFDYDFSSLEKDLNIDCFTILSKYHAIQKSERSYNHNVSSKVRVLSDAIAKASNEIDVFFIMTNFYENYGVGMFGLNKAFRIETNAADEVYFIPINNMENVMLDDLIGYHSQKQELLDNTEAFVHGRGANNVLLQGESGTGKSTSIKAIVNAYYDQGLRMIEVYKHQFKDLSKVIGAIKNRNYRFIIYMDDLSFEEFEIEYKFLKAVIEGGVETRPDNILIYATSNRRNLVREMWKDRNDIDENDELHRSETMSEKLSLVARFGINIYYGKPSPKEYHEMVKILASRYPQITLSDEELWLAANQWELHHGGVSGRSAQQLINYLAGKEKK